MRICGEAANDVTQHEKAKLALESAEFDSACCVVYVGGQIALKCEHGAFGVLLGHERLEEPEIVEKVLNALHESVLMEEMKQLEQQIFSCDTSCQSSK